MSLPNPCGDKPAKPRGRPLSFDREAALEAAMHIFWEHGYEGATISELTAAMGITAPSLYTAFGDKERLFWEAIERYVEGPGSGLPRALAEEPTARGAIERLLREAANELTRSSHPRGCMMTMAAMNCTVASSHIQAALAKRRAAAETGMRERILQGVREGELPADTDAAALARLFTAVYGGMSMQAKDGATRAQLLATAEAAMRAWPPAPAKPVAESGVKGAARKRGSRAAG
jgi:TetR/AcrR family transcriptional regulator, copper-responsive repressor